MPPQELLGRPSPGPRQALRPVSAGDGVTGPSPDPQPAGTMGIKGACACVSAASPGYLEERHSELSPTVPAKEQRSGLFSRIWGRARWKDGVVIS